jgi:hypothetical protein
VRRELAGHRMRLIDVQSVKASPDIGKKSGHRKKPNSHYLKLTFFKFTEGEKAKFVYDS